MIRKIDSAGNVLVPQKYRQLLRINPGDELEFFVESDTNTIVIKKYQDYCVLCNCQSNLKEINGKKLCMECIRGIISTWS
jgi:transcriptional pleiotropic regulator of transition state genes